MKNNEFDFIFNYHKIKDGKRSGNSHTKCGGEKTYLSRPIRENDPKIGIIDMIKMPGLTLEIKGERISTYTFKKAIENFFNFVNDVSSQMTEKRKPFRWNVDVDKGSILLNLAPEPRKEDIPIIPNVIKKIESGINIITTEGKRPKYYTDEALNYLRELATTITPQKAGINKINIFTNGNQNEVTTKVIPQIDALLQIRREEFGSFEGRLEVISSRGGYHFNLYEFINDYPIKCIFKEDIIEKVLGAFGKRIYVFGLIKYKKGGIPSIIHVEKLRIFREKHEIPAAKDVLGILKDIN